MPREQLLNRTRATQEEALGAGTFMLEVTGDSPPLLLDDQAPVYRSVCDEMHQHASHSVAFATDAGWFQTLDMDCVIWGPGSIEVAHKPDESMPKDAFAEADRILARLIHRHLTPEA